MSIDPFAALGLPATPDLTDEQVRAAWRTIAAATHPDRPDGGNIPRYTAAANAYAQLRTPWRRSEAYADRTTTPTHVPAPAAHLPAPPIGWWRAVRRVPARIRHGRPARLLCAPWPPPSCRCWCCIWCRGSHPGRPW
jgi:hypothetical protein